MAGHVAIERPPITHSPWFWVHVFATAALIGILLVGPKFRERQLRQERNFQGRQRVLEERAGRAATTELSTEDSLLLDLRPLAILLGVVFLLSWIQLWRTHFRARRRGVPIPRREEASP